MEYTTFLYKNLRLSMFKFDYVDCDYIHYILKITMSESHKNLLRNLLISKTVAKSVAKDRALNRSSSNNTDMLSRIGDCIQKKNEFIIEFEREDKVQLLKKEI